MNDVILTQPHTHAGVPHQAGERIEVDVASASWLIAVGAATLPAPTPRGKTSRPAIAAPTEPNLSTDQEL